jgi:hypothetical protein
MGGMYGSSGIMMLAIDNELEGGNHTVHFL